jgi:outer membrane lipoprotein-sorting protein
MKRIFLTLATVIATALPAAAEKLSLGAISTYFSNLKLAQAPFTQVSGDGYVTTGQLWINRPGKMRFNYDGPNASYVVATLGAVYIVDGKSNQPPEVYPLKRTPLSFLLSKDVDFAQANAVIGHETDGVMTIVTTHAPDKPDLGQLELHFSANPTALSKWVVISETGERTTVILGPLIYGQAQSRELYVEPRRRRN